MTTLLRSSTPRAKKQYNCNWCREPIEIYRLHSVESYVYDHQAYTLRCHTECAEAWHRLIKISDYDEEGVQAPDEGIRGSFIGYYSVWPRRLL